MINGKNKIKSARTYLRGVVLADQADVFAILGDRDNCHYQYGLPLSGMQDAYVMLHSAEGIWNKYVKSPMNREFMFVIKLQENDNTIGLVWVSFNRDITEMEFRCITDKQYWQCGYTSEAVQALLDAYVNEYMSLVSVRAVCDHRNKGARMLLEKLGMQKVGVQGKENIYQRKYVKLC